MSSLIIESFPDSIYARLKQVAESHRRSVPQETILQLEKALATEESGVPAQPSPRSSYWSNRKLVPEYEAAMKAGAFSGGTDSSDIISDEREAR